MRLHIVEALGAERVSSTSEPIISLTPEASWELITADLSYKTPEEYYSQNDVYHDSDVYYADQMRWFDEFDRYLAENFPNSKTLKSARAHANQLKILLDTVVAESRILQILFRKGQFSEVVYYRRRPKSFESNSVYNLYYERPSFYSLLVEQIAKKNGVSKVTIKDVDAREHFKNAGFSLPERIKSHWRRFHLERISSNSAKQSLRVLLMHTGCLSMDLMWSELKKSGVKIFTETDVYRSGHFAKSHSDLSQNCNEAVRGLAASGLYELWDTLSGIEIRGILGPYLADFIRKDVLRDQLEIGGWLGFFEDEHIDLLICRSSAGREIATALQAARRIPGMKTVCCQHGASVLDELYWTMTEIAPFDVYFAMDTEAKDYFKDRSHATLADSCQVEESSHYLRYLAKAEHAPKPSSLQTILYAPAKVFFDIQNFNLTRYSIAWYFELQMKLIEVFSRFPQQTFIYKTLPDQEARLSRWVREFVARKNIKNVTFQSGLFTDCLKSAGKVLVDLPSTALYEAAVTGLPVYSLLPNYCKTWQGAEEMFGKSIGRFSSISEAARLVETFLADGKTDYRAQVRLEKSSVVRQLEQLKKELSYERLVSQR